MSRKSEQILRREKMTITLDQLLELFIATKQTEAASPRTVEWYTHMLSRFIRFLGEGATLNDLTLNNARAFVADLQGRKQRYENHPVSHPKEGGLSPHTIHTHVRAIKVFSSWLAQEGFVKSNPLEKLKPPKLPQTMIEVLSDQEIEAILRAINPNCFLGARLYAIVLLLLDTGIRASELRTLTVDNTFLDDNYIKVVGKGNKERIVPFGSTTKKALLRYLYTWRPQPATEETKELFLTNEGMMLSQEALGHTIKRLGVKAGVPRLHPHLFRHSFAVHYLVNGGDLMTLKLILGHTTLQVTEMYIHLAQSHIQVQHSKFSPVDRLGISPSNRRVRRAVV